MDIAQVYIHDRMHAITYAYTTCAQLCVYVCINVNIFLFKTMYILNKNFHTFMKYINGFYKWIFPRRESYRHISSLILFLCRKHCFL